MDSFTAAITLSSAALAAAFFSSAVALSSAVADSSSMVGRMEKVAQANYASESNGLRHWQAFALRGLGLPDHPR
jgi:hypothetical protein